MAIVGAAGAAPAAAGIGAVIDVIAALPMGGKVFGLVWSRRTSAGSDVGLGIRVAEHVGMSREAR